MERDKRPDILEQKFRELEVKLVENIKTCWVDEPGRGVSLEIAVNGDDSLILRITDEGVWYLGGNWFEFESGVNLPAKSGPEINIGKKPPLNELLLSYAGLAENFPELMQKWKKLGSPEERMGKYVIRNRERLVGELMEAMQEVIDESEVSPVLPI